MTTVGTVTATAGTTQTAPTTRTVFDDVSRDRGPRRTYRAYVDAQPVAHTTATSDTEALARLLEHVPGLTAVVSLDRSRERPVWP